MTHRFSICCFLLVVCAFFACDKNSDGPMAPVEAFDREALLTDWADEMIVPSLEAYLTSMGNHHDAQVLFFNSPDATSLGHLRSTWLEAYKSWQRVAMYDIGRAEEMGLRNATNIYPTDTDLIKQNVSTQNYKLALPSNNDAQGFPALDFLYFGLADTDEDLIGILSSPEYQSYSTDLVDRMQLLTTGVLNDWNTSFRDDFIANSGASATASVDKMVNDFLFYYEKFLRAGKIGIPAGVFSGSPLGSTVEAPFSGVHSKELFLASFQAVQDFFEGVGFDGVRREVSLLSYIASTSGQDDTRDLGQEITAQWSKAEEAVSLLSDNFKAQVETDNTLMLNAYDELQKAIILLKVDMMQTLNIQVDYVDADGD